MKAKAVYPIVVVQFAIAFSMWYLSLTNPIRYQSAWAMLLGIEMILTALILLAVMRFYLGGVSEE